MHIYFRNNTTLIFIIPEELYTFYMESSKKKLLWIIVVIVLIWIVVGVFLLTTRFDLMRILQDFITNPVVYLSLLFIYSFLVAIILPIPIELALLWPLANGDMVFYGVVTIVMALGKTIGAWGVFFIGLKLEEPIRDWSKRFKIVETIVDWLTIFVRKTKYIGIFILLSIPLMTDTIPLYLYSLFNEEGKVLNMKLFGLVNFSAAIVRSIILLLLWTIFKISLFG